MSKDDDDDCEVGYGKPPKEHQFKPGQSGNRTGRRKGARDLKTDLAEELEEKVTVTENGKRVQVTKRRLIIKALVNKAAKGDTKAAEQTLRWYQLLVGTASQDPKAMPTANEDAQLIANWLKGQSGGLDGDAEDAGATATAARPAANAGGEERDDR